MSRKRLLLMGAVLLSWMLPSGAYNLTVNNIEVDRTRSAKMYIGVDCETEMWHAFSMDIKLPAGFSMKYNSLDKPEMTVLDRIKDDFSVFSNYQQAKDVWSFAILHSTMHGVAPGTAPMFYVTLKADDGVKDGTYAGTIHNVVAADMGDRAVYFDNTPFTITVKNGEVILDELSTEKPITTTDAVTARVSRTIGANVWSTICLPFAMTGEQVSAAFGSDVKVADYTGWDDEYASDEDDHPCVINVSFKTISATANGLEANHPYIIKTSRDITSFTVEGVAITPKDEPAVTTGSSRRHNLGSFTGTYVANFTVPEQTLFLASGEFWYSVGKTKMKAFRAYFEFADVLQSYFDDSAAAKVSLVFDEPTGISGVRSRQASDEKAYTLDGRMVGQRGLRQLPKGVYIVGGRKVVK